MAGLAGVSADAKATTIEHGPQIGKHRFAAA
jgi:hypothetical protein